MPNPQPEEYVLNGAGGAPFAAWTRSLVTTFSSQIPVAAARVAIPSSFKLKLKLNRYN